MTDASRFIRSFTPQPANSVRDAALLTYLSRPPQRQGADDERPQSSLGASTGNTTTSPNRRRHWGPECDTTSAACGPTTSGASAAAAAVLTATGASAAIPAGAAVADAQAERRELEWEAMDLRLTTLSRFLAPAINLARSGTIGGIRKLGGQGALPSSTTPNPAPLGDGTLNATAALKTNLSLAATFGGVSPAAVAAPPGGLVTPDSMFAFNTTTSAAQDPRDAALAMRPAFPGTVGEQSRLFADLVDVSVFATSQAAVAAYLDVKFLFEFGVPFLLPAFVPTALGRKRNKQRAANRASGIQGPSDSSNGIGAHVQADLAPSNVSAPRTATERRAYYLQRRSACRALMLRALQHCAPAVLDSATAMRHHGGLGAPSVKTSHDRGATDAALGPEANAARTASHHPSRRGSAHRRPSALEAFDLASPASPTSVKGAAAADATFLTRDEATTRFLDFVIAHDEETLARLGLWSTTSGLSTTVSGRSGSGCATATTLASVVDLEASSSGDDLPSDSGDEAADGLYRVTRAMLLRQQGGSGGGVGAKGTGPSAFVLQQRRNDALAAAAANVRRRAQPHVDVTDTTGAITLRRDGTVHQPHAARSTQQQQAQLLAVASLRRRSSSRRAMARETRNVASVGTVHQRRVAIRAAANATAEPWRREGVLGTVDDDADDGTGQPLDPAELDARRRLTGAGAAHLRRCRVREQRQEVAIARRHALLVAAAARSGRLSADVLDQLVEAEAALRAAERRANTPAKTAALLARLTAKTSSTGSSPTTDVTAAARSYAAAAARALEQMGVSRAELQTHAFAVDPSFVPPPSVVAADAALQRQQALQARVTQRRHECVLAAAESATKTAPPDAAAKLKALEAALAASHAAVVRSFAAASRDTGVWQRRFRLAMGGIGGPSVGAHAPSLVTADTVSPWWRQFADDSWVARDRALMAAERERDGADGGQHRRRLNITTAADPQRESGSEDDDELSVGAVGGGSASNLLTHIQPNLHALQMPDAAADLGALVLPLRAVAGGQGPSRPAALDLPGASLFEWRRRSLMEQQHVEHAVFKKRAAAAKGLVLEARDRAAATAAATSVSNFSFRGPDADTSVTDSSGDRTIYIDPFGGKDLTAVAAHALEAGERVAAALRAKTVPLRAVERFMTIAATGNAGGSGGTGGGSSHNAGAAAGGAGGSVWVAESQRQLLEVVLPRERARTAVPAPEVCAHGLSAIGSGAKRRPHFPPAETAFMPGETDRSLLVNPSAAAALVAESGPAALAHRDASVLLHRVRDEQTAFPHVSRIAAAVVDRPGRALQSHRGQLLPAMDGTSAALDVGSSVANSSVSYRGAEFLSHSRIAGVKGGTLHGSSVGASQLRETSGVPAPSSLHALLGLDAAGTADASRHSRALAGLTMIPGSAPAPSFARAATTASLIALSAATQPSPNTSIHTTHVPPPRSVVGAVDLHNFNDTALGAAVATHRPSSRASSASSASSWSSRSSSSSSASSAASNDREPPAHTTSGGGAGSAGGASTWIALKGVVFRIPMRAQPTPAVATTLYHHEEAEKAKLREARKRLKAVAPAAAVTGPSVAAATFSPAPAAADRVSSSVTTSASNFTLMASRDPRHLRSGASMLPTKLAPIDDASNRLPPQSAPIDNKTARGGDAATVDGLGRSWARALNFSRAAVNRRRRHRPLGATSAASPSAAFDFDALRRRIFGKIERHPSRYNRHVRRHASGSTAAAAQNKNASSYDDDEARQGRLLYYRTVLAPLYSGHDITDIVRAQGRYAMQHMRRYLRAEALRSLVGAAAAAAVPVGAPADPTRKLINDLLLLRDVAAATATSTTRKSVACGGIVATRADVAAPLQVQEDARFLASASRILARQVQLDVSAAAAARQKALLELQQQQQASLQPHTGVRGGGIRPLVIAAQTTTANDTAAYQPSPAVVALEREVIRRVDCAIERAYLAACTNTAAVHGRGASAFDSDRHATTRSSSSVPSVQGYLPAAAVCASGGSGSISRRSRGFKWREGILLRLMYAAAGRDLPAALQSELRRRGMLHAYREACPELYRGAPSSSGSSSDAASAADSSDSSRSTSSDGDADFVSESGSDSDDAATRAGGDDSYRMSGRGRNKGRQAPAKRDTPTHWYDARGRQWRRPRLTVAERRHVNAVFDLFCHDFEIVGYLDERGPNATWHY